MVLMKKDGIDEYLENFIFDAVEATWIKTFPVKPPTYLVLDGEEDSPELGEGGSGARGFRAPIEVEVVGAAPVAVAAEEGDWDARRFLSSRAVSSIRREQSSVVVPLDGDDDVFGFFGGRSGSGNGSSDSGINVLLLVVNEKKKKNNNKG